MLPQLEKLSEFSSDKRKSQCEQCGRTNVFLYEIRYVCLYLWMGNGKSKWESDSSVSKTLMRFCIPYFVIL
jgi:hypothetical protein